MTNAALPAPAGPCRKAGPTGVSSTVGAVRAWTLGCREAAGPLPAELAGSRLSSEW